MFNCLFKKKKDSTQEICDALDKAIAERKRKKFSVSFLPHYITTIEEEPEKEEKACTAQNKKGL